MELNDLVRQIGENGFSSVFGSTAEERAAHVAGWSDAYKLRVAFEVGKREMLTQEIRDVLGMGPPPPPIVDNIYDDLDNDKKEDDDDERADGDAEEEDEEEDEPKIPEVDGTVV